MQPRTRTLLAASVGLVLLAGLVLHAGPAKVADALRRADLRLVLLAVLCYATFFALRGWRWAMLLRPIHKDGRRFSVWTTTNATAVGWLGNSLLPMRAGEMARAGVVARRESVPFFAVASSVAIERVLDVAGLAVAAALSFLLIPETVALPAWTGFALKLAAIMPLVGLALLAAAAFARPTVMRLLDRMLSPLPERVRGKLLATFDHLVDGAEPIVRRPALLVKSLTLTLVMTVAQMSIFAFLLMAFLPSTPLLLALAGAPWFILSFAISITPGNVGTYEAAFAAIYASFGLPAGELLATAVLTHLATFLTVVVLGSLALIVLGADVRALVAARGRGTGAAAKPAEVS